MSSGILPGIFSGINFGIYSNIRHSFWHSISNLFWHSSWHSLWHEFTSRRTPQHPGLAIWSSGPGIAHCIRSWQRKTTIWLRRRREKKKKTWEGVAPLLKSRDPTCQVGKNSDFYGRCVSQFRKPIELGVCVKFGATDWCRLQLVTPVRRKRSSSQLSYL